MDKSARHELNLTPRTDEELHAALDAFELKWRNKANRVMSSRRISRF
jgi:hypothetical protein